MLTSNLGYAVNLHRLANRFGGPHRADHTPVVEHLTDTVAITFAQAFVIDMFADVVMHRKSATRRMECAGKVPVCGFARGHDIVLRA